MNLKSRTCYIFIMSIFILGFSSCTKKYNTTNNYYTTPASTAPSFLVEGISNIAFTNDIFTAVTLNITVQYEDSAQQNVSLSVSGLPAGVVMDTTWQNRGIPTFTTTLTIYDTSAAGATPGTYTASLTATTSSGEQKTYPFTIKISSLPASFFGSYTDCTTSCTPSTVYTDSMYADRTTGNKIWFTNFANSGNLVYGLISNGGALTIPVQMSGGIQYSGASTTSLDFVDRQMSIHYTAGATNCNLSMQ